MRNDDITLQPSKYLNDTPIERTLFNAFKWGFVLFYVLFMLVLFFMGDFIEQPRKFNPSAKGGNWMSYISDDTYISDISIPGTHDSASYRRGGIYSLAHCQNLNLENQLKVGVRYFDIRLDKDYKDRLYVYHGILNQQISFDEVWNIFNNFLKEHPSETILMSIKCEDSNNKETMQFIHEDLLTKQDNMYTGNKVPKLGDVRGKIVLFRRYSFYGYFGINARGHGTEYNCTYNIEGYGADFHIQDNCILEERSELADKWDFVRVCLDYCRNRKVPTTFVINVTAAYVKQAPNLDIPRYKYVRDYIQPRLKEYILSQPKICYGIILFDCISEDLSSLIYETNF